MAKVQIVVTRVSFSTSPRGMRMMTMLLAEPALHRATEECRTVAQARDLLDAAVADVKRAHPGVGFHAFAHVVEGRKPAGFDKARLRLDLDPADATAPLPTPVF